METQRKLNVTDYTGILSHTSHPHVMADGTVYNLGMTVTKSGPQYNIICFPSGSGMFENARIVATIPSRWKLYPAYMHTFGITDNYFIIVEQPLSISVPEMIFGQIRSQPMAGNFKWFGNHPTCIYIISRMSGQLVQTFEADAFFYLHIINAYETGDYIVVDICCYKDPSMLDCMYIEALKNMQSNPDYAKMFRGKPVRFVLPLKESKVGAQKHSKSLLRSLSISNFVNRISPNCKQQASLKRSASENRGMQYRSIEDIYQSTLEHEHTMANLVQLNESSAKAFRMPNSKHIFCKPELLCDIGCETPRIFYDIHMGNI